MVGAVRPVSALVTATGPWALGTATQTWGGCVLGTTPRAAAPDCQGRVLRYVWGLAPGTVLLSQVVAALGTARAWCAHMGMGVVQRVQMRLRRRGALRGTLGHVMTQRTLSPSVGGLWVSLAA